MISRRVAAALAVAEDILIDGAQSDNSGEAYKDANDLWDILTALRSSDTNRDDDFKETTTEPIRSAVFPRLAVLPGASRGIANFAPIGTPYTKPLDDPFGHFEEHSNRAAKALGLLP